MLDAGADDYVVKPFSAEHLAARLRAVLRRSADRPEAAAVTVGGLEVDSAGRVARLDGETLDLTRKEFDLLELLMRQPGVTLKREHIMSAVWDENWWGSTRTLDTHTSTLRRKILDDTDPPSKIVTVRGVGFRFDPGGGCLGQTGQHRIADRQPGIDGALVRGDPHPLALF